MAKKLRKMLGSASSPSTIALQNLIDTQSKATICAWCMNYAEANVLPIFEKHCPGDDRPRKALDAARSYLAGDVKFTEVKNIVLNECHAAARELDADPVAQAAARACGQGSAVVHTLSHSLGLFFYAAAAIAYDRVGTEEPPEVYEAIAEEVCADMTADLQAIAIPSEPNPAKIKWSC